MHSKIDTNKLTLSKIDNVLNNPNNNSKLNQLNNIDNSRNLLFNIPNNTSDILGQLIPINFKKAIPITDKNFLNSQKNPIGKSLTINEITYNKNRPYLIQNGKKLLDKHNTIEFPNYHTPKNDSLERSFSVSVHSQKKGININERMQKILGNVSNKLKDTKNYDEKHCISFYLNDNESNKKYKLKNNKITTTKYNVFTFLPKGLLIQLSRLSNVYFLVTAVIQSIPIISPLYPETAIIPLIFVISISLIREGIEDFSRRVYDNISNKEKIKVLKDGYFIEVNNETLRSGEIIYIGENKIIPSDMLILDSGLKEGTCYVETSSLDGEKNLKLKIANKKTCGIFNDIIDNNNFDKINEIKISGFIKVGLPNKNLNEIGGKIDINIIKNNEEKKEYFAITNREFLLKGSILRNTNWIIGVILYTGMNNKIVLNSKKPPSKISKIEKIMNRFLCIIFIFLSICCLCSTIMYNYLHEKHDKFYTNFLKYTPKLAENMINFFTYFLLLNTMIPISLVVSIEIVKIFQGLFIKWDIKLYSKIRHTFCKVRTVSIIEELGNINFIFSDKTGTITKNELNFKYCIIGNIIYQYRKVVDNYQKLENEKKEIFSNLKYCEEIKILDDYSFLNYTNLRQITINPLKKFRTNEERKKMKLMLKKIEIADNFWKCLALNNECLVNEENGELKYIGTSPDDLELVKTASIIGYKLINTSIEKKILKINNEDAIEYEILNVLGFSSKRKRMSIIVRENNIIKIFCKGADCEIIKRLSQEEFKKNSFKLISENLEIFSKLGYRTMMAAYKIIEEVDYKIWIERLRKEELNINNKNHTIEKCYDIIEDGFELLGGTIVEDQLQDKVPETITKLKNAGIKIWVLTGDKMDTVESIGYSCNLLNKKDIIFKLSLVNKDNDEKLTRNIEVINFFNDFYEYLIDKFPEIITKNNEYITLYEVFKNKLLPENIIDNITEISERINKIIEIAKNTKININFSILIESPILNDLFLSDFLTKKFLDIAYEAHSVICCRVSPYQKSQVITKVKKFWPDVVSLAIGDGGNDISMLMEANIGIGVFGEEGLSAVRSSDFAIGEFKFLERLLFFHGRININRISKMIIYFFYKNFIFTMSQFFFAFYNLSSGQTIIDDWYITCYNLIFTSIPLCVLALTDFEVKQEDNNKKFKEILPFLYKKCRKKHGKYILLWKLIGNTILSIFLSLLIFFICSINEINGSIGNEGSLWGLSLVIFESILIVVSCNLIIRANLISFLLPIVLIWSLFLFIIFICIVHYGYLFKFNSIATVFPMHEQFKFYLQILLSCFFNILIDYTIKIYNFYFDNSLENQLQLNVLKNKEKKEKIAKMEIKKFQDLKKENKSNSAIAALNQSLPNDLGKPNNIRQMFGTAKPGQIYNISCEKMNIYVNNIRAKKNEVDY